MPHLWRFQVGQAFSPRDGVQMSALVPAKVDAVAASSQQIQGQGGGGEPAQDLGAPEGGHQGMKNNK